MVTIRLARYGNKKRPFYKIVIADNRSPRDGRFIENIGYFNPLTKKKYDMLKIDINRIQHWKKQGAKPSKRIISLLRKVRKKEENL